ncbi:universal stress protein [Planktotalea frisia]|uniref:universal stress protein n=1 Tax=Planktotalea frisia TaxID=696762 RepID=UPI0009341D29|nr:universal stress protein [Planktotalea frisia]
MNAQHHVLSGTVYDSVLETADKLGADVIIIGAHQPKLRDYLLGANAAKVVRHSKQSVLMVRSAG